MANPLTPEATQQRSKRRSITVWVLAIALAVTPVVAFVLVRSLSVIDSDFDTPPPEQRVRSASVIVLAKWERSGSTLRCVISEILKRAPDTAFYYKVGDEYSALNQRVRDNADFGEGEVLFFNGSPARLELASAYRGDRITGLGDMPISMLRELIAADQ
jgi:hypothetical protein